MAGQESIPVRASPPIEIRQFVPRYGLAHANAGINPLVQSVKGERIAFGAPVLQYRVKETVFVNGERSLQWSEWMEVQFVREGVDDAEDQGA